MQAYLEFTLMPVESYRRRLRPLPLCSSDVFRGLINSLCLLINSTQVLRASFCFTFFKSSTASKTNLKQNVRQRSNKLTASVLVLTEQATKTQPINKISFFSLSFFVVFDRLSVVYVSFCGLTKEISPKMCILCVRVKINKRSFEPFQFLDQVLLYSIQRKTWVPHMDNKQRQKQNLQSVLVQFITLKVYSAKFTRALTELTDSSKHWTGKQHSSTKK